MPVVTTVLAGTQPGHQFACQNVKQLRLWRSLGDSNPCFELLTADWNAGESAPME
jgi:hypothetical protein